MAKNYKVKAEIVDLSSTEAAIMHREILRVRDEVAPKAHGHVVHFNVGRLLGGGKKKELGSGD